MIKVGKKVRVTDRTPGMKVFSVGAMGTVLHITKSKKVLVRFTSGSYKKTHLPCHLSYQGTLEKGDWWVNKENLEIVQEEEKMYEIKKLETFEEVIAEGRAQRNALGNATYAKRLRKAKIDVYVCRKLDAPEKPFVTFAVAPEGTDQKLLVGWEQWGTTYVNIRGYQNTEPASEVATYVKAWCNGKGLIDVPPKKRLPLLTISNGNIKVLEAYELADLRDFVADVATQLMGGAYLTKELLSDLGYTVEVNEK